MKKRFSLIIFLVIFAVGFWVWFDKVSRKERPLRADVLAEIHRRIDQIDNLAKKTDSAQVFTLAKPAISQLTFIGTPAAPYLLKEALNKERNVLARMVYIQILAGIENKESVPYFISLLEDEKEDEGVRMQSACALGILKDERAISPLKASLLDKNKRVAEISAEALKNFRK